MRMFKKVKKKKKIKKNSIIKKFILNNLYYIIIRNASLLNGSICLSKNPNTL